VDNKVPTFTRDKLQVLYQARSADLGLPLLPVQQSRFQELCGSKLCLNRRVTFNEMNLGLRFA
jgi:hypothetical protein